MTKLLRNHLLHLGAPGLRAKERNVKMMPARKSSLWSEEASNRNHPLVSHARRESS